MAHPTDNKLKSGKEDREEISTEEFGRQVLFPSVNEGFKEATDEVPSRILKTRESIGTTEAISILSPSQRQQARRRDVVQLTTGSIKNSTKSRNSSKIKLKRGLEKQEGNRESKKRKRGTNVSEDDIARQQHLRKVRKFVLGQDQIRNKKIRENFMSSEDDKANKQETKTLKMRRKSSSIVDNPESLKEIFKAFPEARAIKKRIENAIKKDAAKEFIKLRAINGGIAGSGDYEKIVRIYNAFGFKFITQGSISYQASLLVNTNACKTILSRYGVETVALGDEETNCVDATTAVDQDVTGTHAKRPGSRNDDLGTDTGATEPENILDATNSLEEANTKPKKRKHGGRPKGSTKDKLALKPPKRGKQGKDVAKDKLILELMTKVSETYYAERERAKLKGEKVANGTLAKIIADLEKENHLPAGTLNWKSIISRVGRDNLTGKASQKTPLIEGIEPEVVDCCVKLAKMGQALSKEQVILIGNQLVKKYNLVDEILEFKKRRKIMEEGDDPEQQAMLRAGWFQGFKTRHMENIIKTCGNELCDIRRHFDLRVEHFKTMYDRVYESMVDAGIAEKFNKPTLFDINGGRVAPSDREWAYGLPSRYKVTRPEFLLHVDEVGTKVKANRQLNFYGHIDGQMLGLPVNLAGTGLDSENETIDMKFSVYCFTNGEGQVVLCAIIYMSDKDVMDLPLSVRWGIDTLKPLHGGSTDLELFERNCGPGQAMQGGPTCNYMGKEVSCFIGTACDGKLNSQHVLEILQYLDEIELFDRSTSSLRPFLLLDGHGSCFDVEFLSYVSDAAHPWVVSCGLPKDTHLLRVAFSDEFNASFKEEFSIAKESLLDSRVYGRKEFYPTDIVPLVHHAWSTSYVQCERAKRAMAFRGWNPLNYALLLHPMLIKRGQLQDVKKSLT